MFTRYRNFIRGVSANWPGRLGVVLTTSTFCLLVILELARLLGVITNAYVGLITYMLLPALFVVGLLLIPLGWRRLKKQTGLSGQELLARRFDSDVAPAVSGSPLWRTLALLTALNVVFLVVVSANMLHFMDQPSFCGTACHSVMNPEWVTYQQSPHARVACVECHVGEGAEALLDAKLNGLWQIISISFDLLERPIPTPVHQLRPARETCEKCHWPEKFYGSRLRTMASYQPDESSTPLYTTLNLKIDANRLSRKAGIHWHVGHDNQVRYSSIDDEREQIVWAEVRHADSTNRRFVNRELASLGADSDNARTMDCVDCHNRATHVYEDPERAVDYRMELGLLDRSLPFIKREGLRALRNDYPTRQAAEEGIANHIRGFYARRDSVPLPEPERMEAAIAVLQTIYDRNIHPEMKITWGTYPSHIGHIGDAGCFRCHNAAMVDSSGSAISYDCTLCHSILADRHPNPFWILSQPDSTDPDLSMHEYLRQEFLGKYAQ